MWDNLQAHLTDLVYETVQGRETPNIFQIVRCPPYQPKYAPIEYIICEIASQLQKEIMAIDTTATMIPKIQQIALRVGQDGKANNTFIHCGY